MFLPSPAMWESLLGFLISDCGHIFTCSNITDLLVISLGPVSMVEGSGYTRNKGSIPGFGKTFILLHYKLAVHERGMLSFRILV